MLAPGCVRVTGGGNFCRALLQSAFLIVLFLLLPLRAAALHGNYLPYSSTDTLNFTHSSLKAFTVEVVEGSLVLHPMQVVPPETGILIYIEQGKTANVRELYIENAQPDVVPPNHLVAVLSDKAIPWQSEDSCYNYILQDNNFRRATGKKLRAGGAYLHTSYDISKAAALSDEAFTKLVVKEKNSLEAFIERQPGWSFYLFGLVIGFIGLGLFRWTKRRYHKEI